MKGLRDGSLLVVVESFAAMTMKCMRCRQNRGRLASFAFIAMERLASKKKRGQLEQSCQAGIPVPEIYQLDKIEENGKTVEVI